MGLVSQNLHGDRDRSVDRAALRDPGNGGGKAAGGQVSGRVTMGDRGDLATEAESAVWVLLLRLDVVCRHELDGGAQGIADSAAKEAASIPVDGWPRAARRPDRRRPRQNELLL